MPGGALSLSRLSVGLFHPSLLSLLDGFSLILHPAIISNVLHRYLCSCIVQE